MDYTSNGNETVDGLKIVDAQKLKERVIALEDKLIETAKILHQYHSQSQNSHWQDCTTPICSGIKAVLRTED